MPDSVFFCFRTSLLDSFWCNPPRWLRVLEIVALFPSPTLQMVRLISLPACLFFFLIFYRLRFLRPLRLWRCGYLSFRGWHRQPLFPGFFWFTRHERDLHLLFLSRPALRKSTDEKRQCLSLCFLLCSLLLTSFVQESFFVLFVFLFPSETSSFALNPLLHQFGRHARANPGL